MEITFTDVDEKECIINTKHIDRKNGAKQLYNRVESNFELTRVVILQ